MRQVFLTFYVGLLVLGGIFAPALLVTGVYSMGWLFAGAEDVSGSLLPFLFFSFPMIMIGLQGARAFLSSPVPFWLMGIAVLVNMVLGVAAITTREEWPLSFFMGMAALLWSLILAIRLGKRRSG